MVDGKDSNLRTRKEGQIYSLLALTTHPPVRSYSGFRAPGKGLNEAIVTRQTAINAQIRINYRTVMPRGRE